MRTADLVAASAGGCIDDRDTGDEVATMHGAERRGEKRRRRSERHGY